MNRTAKITTDVLRRDYTDYQQETTVEMIGGRCCDIVIPAIRGHEIARTRTAVVVAALVVYSSVVLSRSLPSPRDGVAVRDGLGGAGEMRRVPRPPPFNTFCHELSPQWQLQSTPAPIGQLPPRAFHPGH
ncbi:hypothetical protein ACI65C_008878 [Semiaphis heraclei]